MHIMDTATLTVDKVQPADVIVHDGDWVEVVEVIAYDGEFYEFIVRDHDGEFYSYEPKPDAVVTVAILR